MSNLQLNKLESGTKNSVEVILILSSNSKGETNVPHKLLLTNSQVSRLHKVLHSLFKLSKIV